MTADIIKRLEDVDQSTLAYPFQIEPVTGDSAVHRVVVEGQPEFPIALSEADGELLCMIRLFGLDEIKGDRKSELFEKLLAGNLTLPLSAFGVADNTVFLYGSLASESKTDVIVQEIQMLAGNTIEALELVEDYLAA